MLALRLWLQGESGKMSASDENSAIFVRQGAQGGLAGGCSLPLLPGHSQAFSNVAAHWRALDAN